MNRINFKKIVSIEDIFYFQGIDLWITPYKFIRIQTGKDTSRCINYKYPILS